MASDVFAAVLWMLASQGAGGGEAYQQAVEARLAGDFAAAETQLVSLVQAHPDHADAWLQLGLARSALGDFQGADEAFVRTLELAPDYPDAWLGRARIAYFRNDYANARRHAMRAGPSAEADALMARIEAAEVASDLPRWRLDLFAGRASLTNGLENWSEFGLALGRRLDASTSLTLQMDSAERFGLDDQYFAVRLDRALGDRSAGYVALGGAPDAVFRPEIALRAGVSGPLGDGGWSGSADLFAGQYLSGDVQSVTLGIYRTFASERLRLGARLIGLSDEAGETRSGFALVSEWQAAAPTRMSFSYTDAPETSEGVTLDVRAFSAAVRHELDDRRAISLTLLHEDRRAYDRSAFVAGVSWRF
ncbi:YaiO family outer membrane beta-barrel protein [Hyphobacterium sp. HN65]|uniref:YaiO family outer membrane beta-barrel protein n=1 Tax=Hyphobacterium lacteum TaxID=3116575 RepID=A0ABU7LSB5_9PROT|nr:YaiO family outer membrane beta-barrel protein [Hyphobacterium sp. HN65]MEE2526811.1 YaiO family outer membrane beta-barrel protein [Hyphobacterium sp. HN65]